jgi:hypothetical protein
MYKRDPFLTEIPAGRIVLEAELDITLVGTTDVIGQPGISTDGWTLFDLQNTHVFSPSYKMALLPSFRLQMFPSDSAAPVPAPQE